MGKINGDSAGLTRFRNRPATYTFARSAAHAQYLVMTVRTRRGRLSRHRDSAAVDFTGGGSLRVAPL